jgi:hypothetical protein
MTRFSFGDATEEDDIMEVQGQEYHLVPVGMRMMRRMINEAKNVRAGDENDMGLAEERIQAAIDLVIASVRPDERERMQAQIDESIPPAMLVHMGVVLTQKMSDLDPTLLASLSAGSSPTGPSSTDGAVPAASIPSL